MLRHVRDHGIAYLVAVLATAAVAALRSAIGSDVGDAVTNIPFVVPVLLAARYGGFVPGVFATVLCATASVFLFVPPHFTFHIVTRAGVAGALMFTVVGVTVSWVCQSLRDLQARSRRIDDALRDSEERFRAFIDHGPMRAWLKDEDGRYVFVSRSAAKALGGRGEQIIGRTDLELLPAEAAERVRANDVEVLATGIPTEFTERSPEPDGEHHIVSIKFPVRDAHGARYVGGIGIDVTAQLRADEENRRLKDRLAAQLVELQTLLDILPVGVVQAGRDGTGLVGNRAAQEMLRLQQDGRPAGSPPFRCFADGVEIPPDQLPMRRAARGKAPVLGHEHDVVFADGTIRSLFCNVAPVLDAAGEVRAVLGAFTDVTERKKHERELSGLVQRLRTLMDNTPLALVEWDADFRITRWSGLAERVFGWSSAEVVGRSADDFGLVHEDDRAAARAARDRLLDPASRYVVSCLRNRTRDGQVRWCEWYDSVLHDEDGRVVALLSLVLDVTERRVAEQRVAAERERVQLVADAVPALISYIDADACYRLNNRAYETWFHRPSDQFVGRHMRDTVGDAAWEVLRPHVAAALSGRVVGYETEVPYQDGRRWISATYTPDFDESGRVRGFIAHVNDVTERREREDALRASEARFRQLAEAMPQIVWVADANGRTRYLTPHWSDVTGRPVTDGLGDGWAELIHPDDRARVVARWQECVAAGAPYTVEYRLRARDGDYRWHVVRGVPIRDADGRIESWYGSSTDIDEPKRLAEALREADRRKDEFLATLAHELRGPLAPIRNAVHVLRLAPGQPEARDQALGLMERQVARMVRLIEDLLDVSRISKGKIPLRKERVELAAVAHHALEAAMPLIEAQGHALTVSMPGEPLVLFADPARLEQVITNLLTNAAKYTEKGGHVWFNVERQGDEAVITVRDNGIGIAAEHMPHLFAMFSQMTPALERSQGGLGIGLSLVRGLVDMHGGTVSAASDGPGTGSEFVVRLPLVEVAVDREPRQPEPAATPGSSRILVVDDNRDNAETLSMVLRLKGHDVRIAHDGVEAVHAAAAFRPSLILLDIGMPRMNGYEAARRIRQENWGNDVVLVAMTGWGQEEDKRRAIDAGFDHHMTKPIDPDRVERLLGVSSGDRPTES